MSVMIEQTKSFVAKYPYLSLVVAGFVTMIIPIIVALNLLPIGRFLANEGRTSTWLDVVLLNLLRVCLSTPIQTIGSIIIVLGFTTMTTGLFLHVRHRHERVSNAD